MGLMSVLVMFLVSIDAPHYNAGLVHDGRTVRNAAPILGWAIGKHWPRVARYLLGKGYIIEMEVETNGQSS
jgi:hypothetical protein